MTVDRLDRTRADLAEFLKTKRNALSPSSAGLPWTARRRTPGLRREEVATLAGVGLTWYTWLEQGRDINVSSHVLERISHVLQLDELERRHLFILAHKRHPKIRGETTYEITDIVRTLLDDLSYRPAYVFNLRWDVLAWNSAAQRLFRFDEQEASETNMLWMLFANQRLNRRISDWEEQAQLFVSSFRRDFAQAPDDDAMVELVSALEEASPQFRSLWRSQNVHGRCQGKRSFSVDDVGVVEFNHSTLIVNAEEHVRLALYVASTEEVAGQLFAQKCDDQSAGRAAERDRKVL